MRDLKKTTTKGAFQGAVKEYEVDGVEIGVGFTLNMAYVKEDEQGLFGFDDVQGGININGLDAESEEEVIEIANDFGWVENTYAFSEEQKADILKIFTECSELKSDI